MAPERRLRAWRVVMALVCMTVAATPAAADAAGRKKVVNRHASAVTEAKGAKPKEVVAAPKPVSDSSGLGNTTGLTAAKQLEAMTTAIAAAGSFYAGRTTGCAAVTPMLASEAGSIMAGNFRDSDGYCYVWLNLQQSSMLTGSEICKTTLHEMGHLTGLQHSSDPADVMYAPFEADPIPEVC